MRLGRYTLWEWCFFILPLALMLKFGGYPYFTLGFITASLAWGFDTWVRHRRSRGIGVEQEP